MTEAAPDRPRNRLDRETSPYLLQHQENPVHWWAWGPDALAEAKQTGRPILLSVGYAACHWCHVMAHESFEDAETAALMNALFVNIKVDREERPDIDAIYMSALHRLGEQGGWPLTMFLDAEARPFWGGTYFPPAARWGKPSFRSVLQEIARIHREEPGKVAHNAGLILEALKPEVIDGARANITDKLLADVSRRLAGACDPIHGGLQGAPKFPQWNVFWLLWRAGIRYGDADLTGIVRTTLTNICQGGIYDHLGGGFARYAVDARWLVPHFEKMLYDNALLIDLMTEVFRETADPLLKLRITETVDWLAREMIAEGGGFAASLDADSEGEEGKFYVWSSAEIVDVLGPEAAAIFSAAYDVSAEGNWEGHNILNRLDNPAAGDDASEAALARMRSKLLARRAGRIRPGWDDKVLADWNGLMIAALTHASEVFARPDWRVIAKRAFTFVEERMTVEGRLVHAYRAGQAKAPATAQDYAAMIWGALRLYQATLAPRYLEAARRWSDVLDTHYWDPALGGYAFTADDTPDVIVRLRSAHDDATPNANALMLTNLVQLYGLTGQARYAERAEAIPHAFVADLQRMLTGHAGLLANTMDLLAPQQVAVMGAGAEGGGALIAGLRAVSLPGALQLVVASAALPMSPPALAGKTAQNGQPTAYVCAGLACSPPISDAAAFADALERLRMATQATVSDT